MTGSGAAEQCAPSLRHRGGGRTEYERPFGGGGRAGGHVLPQAGPQGPGGQQAAHLEDVVIVGEPAHVAEGRVAAAAAKQGQTTDARGHERLGGARQQL